MLDPTETNLLILMLVFALLIVAALVEGYQEDRAKAEADRQREFWERFDHNRPWSNYKR